MNELSFLAYLPDPFDVKSSRYLVRHMSGECNELSGRELSDYAGPLATYEVGVLIDDLRRGGVLPPTRLICIDDAIRLCAGRARDEGGERIWGFWRNLAQHFTSPESAKFFERVVLSKENRPAPEAVGPLLLEGVAALTGLWEWLRDQLVERGELVRFESVDVPVQQIFHHRQARGIAVDSQIASDFLKRVANEKYLAYSKVAEKLGRSPTGLGFWGIQPHLHKTDIHELADEKDGGRLRDLFKMAAVRSEFARDYLDYSDADRDEAVLRRSAVLGGRIFPEFQAHGTVTGRILVADPYLQQLRRRYRGIFCADLGKRLCYLDYSQFEPGVLASLSGDAALTAAYNGGDVYEALSKAVFGDTESRRISKSMFLAFSYGMTSERVAGLIFGAGNPEMHEQTKGALDHFFAAYPRMLEFRADMQRALLQRGYAESLLGNRRWRVGDGELSSKESRWALNHPVQSTAALIFKEALREIAATFGREAILLPMHDAALLQLPSEDFQHHVQAASQILSAAYSERCPSIQPKITNSDFGAN